jgi:hypothetical protein
MNWIVAKIKWIMLLSGVLTCAALYVAIMPKEALRYLFGKTMTGVLSEVVVRDWAFLYASVGAMLIYAAFQPQCRALVLVVAGVSKLVFLGLILGFGRRFLEEKVNITIGVDLVMVALFVTFLFGMRGISAPRDRMSGMRQQPMPPTPQSAVRIPPAPLPSPAPRPPMAKTP